uniref:Uncharacterized protein n=1 Tax=Oryza glumipatula TaxID=40148 RepID=A0A0E0AE37_9ORYZ
MASTEQQEHAAPLLQPEVEEAYTSDGSLDIDGNPALKHRTGGWRACRSILGAEFCYCLANNGIMYNLVTYLTTQLHQSNVAAAKNVSIWKATCFLTPLAGAVVADSYWGRYRTMVVACCVGVAVSLLRSPHFNQSLHPAMNSAQGMLMASLSALLPQLIESSSTLSMASAQEFVLFLGLYMIAFGVGGRAAAVPDVFRRRPVRRRRHIGAREQGVIIQLIRIHHELRRRDIRHRLGVGARPLRVGIGIGDSGDGPRRRALLPCRRVADVQVSDNPRFFDKAAVVTASDEEAPRNPWRLCVVTQVEELKILVRMLPVWACIAFFYTGTAQTKSTFVKQGMPMDAHVGALRVPPASLAAFQTLTTIVLIPLYDRAPQFVLVGAGELLATIGQLDFFYSQAPPAMKTVCTALGLLAVAAGDYLSSVIVTAVSWATANGGRPGWIPDDLNEGHLDRFFWMMAGLGCLDLLAFTCCAKRYNKSRKAC